MSEVIRPDDPRAATFRTGIEGWVSRCGHFYGKEERQARYAGSTHGVCTECGATCGKSWTKCDPCIRITNDQKWAKLERREWDGVQMLYSQTADIWFSSPDEALDWMSDDEDRPQSLEDMRLVLGDPVGVPLLDSDYCCDRLPDDGDVPEKVQAAMDAFNEAVAGITLSWEVGRYAWKIEGASNEQST